jgi:plasmid replication initiation protein
VAARWRDQEGRRAWVATRAEAIAAGWFGEVDAEVAPRIGDVLVAARDRVAYYVDPLDRGRRMIGQHGSLSAEELAVPLLRFAGWA